MNNDTAHFIEFGPERCWWFNQSRLTLFTTADNGSQVPHLVKRPHWIPVDDLVHLYTLIIRPNGTFETLIDNRSTRNGTFVSDFDPPLFETPTIDDPTDEKPSDWEDRPIVPDPHAVKPDDWDDDAPFWIPDPAKLTPPPGWLVDEEEVVTDPNEKKPASWNEDTMGEWKPRQIANKKCSRATGCGKYKPPQARNKKAHGVWRPKYVPNENYKGEWRPRQIPNPNYKGQSNEFVMPAISGIGFDVWSLPQDFAFTNIAIATDEEAIRKWNNEDFIIRQRRQVRAMKINYQWMEVDLPDDIPEPGIFGRLAYWRRCLWRRWDRVHNKVIVMVVTFTIIAAMMPIMVCCCQMCEPDPFAKMKVD
jgi:calnexin